MGWRRHRWCCRALSPPLSSHPAPNCSLGHSPRCLRSRPSTCVGKQTRQTSSDLTKHTQTHINKGVSFQSKIALFYAFFQLPELVANRWLTTTTCGTSICKAVKPTVMSPKVNKISFQAFFGKLNLVLCIEMLHFSKILSFVI